MKKVLIGLVFTILLIVFVTAQQIPNYKDKYVNDFSNVLDPGQVEQLRSLFHSIDQETTAEIVFVSLDTINGEDISQYSLEIADKWKVGKADKDNGLVILYVKDMKKIWVSTGYGLEGILPDSKVGRLLDENYVPSRDSGNISEGIIYFSNAVSQVILDNKEEVLSGQAGQKGNDWGFFIYIIIFIIFLIIINRFSHRKGGSGFWFIPLFFPFGRSSNSGGFSSGGFGSGGFGGGGFGGGGAGR